MKKTNNSIHVNGVPAYAIGCTEVVVKEVNGELWFWGAYSNEEQSERVAFEIGGLVVDLS